LTINDIEDETNDVYTSVNNNADMLDTASASAGMYPCAEGDASSPDSTQSIATTFRCLGQHDLAAVSCRSGDATTSSTTGVYAAHGEPAATQIHNSELCAAWIPSHADGFPSTPVVSPSQ